MISLMNRTWVCVCVHMPFPIKYNTSCRNSQINFINVWRYIKNKHLCEVWVSYSTHIYNIICFIFVYVAKKRSEMRFAGLFGEIDLIRLQFRIALSNQIWHMTLRTDNLINLNFRFSRQINQFKKKNIHTRMNKWLFVWFAIDLIFKAFRRYQIVKANTKGTKSVWRQFTNVCSKMAQTICTHNVIFIAKNLCASLKYR